MQIFILDENPQVSAQILQELSPKRANKQIVEGMQLFASLAHHYNTQIPLTKNNKLYKLSHQHHPITKHLINSRYATNWLFQNLLKLKEYYPNHKSLSPHNIATALQVLDKPPDNPKTRHNLNLAKSKTKLDPKTSLPLDFTHLPITKAYELYIKAQTNPRTRNKT